MLLSSCWLSIDFQCLCISMYTGQRFKVKILLLLKPFHFFMQTQISFLLQWRRLSPEGIFRLSLSLHWRYLMNDRLLRHFPSLSCSFVFMHDSQSLILLSFLALPMPLSFACFYFIKKIKLLLQKNFKHAGRSSFGIVSGMCKHRSLKDPDYLLS